MRPNRIFITRFRSYDASLLRECKSKLTLFFVGMIYKHNLVAVWQKIAKQFDLFSKFLDRTFGYL